MNLKNFTSFLIGFSGGCLIFLFFMTENSSKIKRKREAYKTENSSNLYETELADQLQNEIKIFCWVFTHPLHHNFKLPSIRDTWSKRCDKLIFISDQVDENFTDIIAMPVENGREHLWNKTKLTMQYVHDRYLNDYDWFMRADDDNYIVMENLRHMLSQYNPKTSLYIGQRFGVSEIFEGVEDGFQNGACHILSRKALEKFVKKLKDNPENCQVADSEFDDVLEGKCLKGDALFVEDHDALDQKRIFPYTMEVHFWNDIDPEFWYWQMPWRNVTLKSLQCCSDLFISMHYVPPWEMYFFEFMIYHLHPFGLEKNLTEEIPRKLSLEEIIKASDRKGTTIFYKEHEKIHRIDDDERY